MIHFIEYLQMQMAGLLQMSCSRADTHAVQNLQSQLSQARSENTSLMVRLNLAEQQVVCLLHFKSLEIFFFPQRKD